MKLEPCQVTTNQSHYFPKSFTLHGKKYQVVQVKRCWNDNSQNPRLGFEVHCAEGDFELFEYVDNHKWMVRKMEEGENE